MVLYYILILGLAALQIVMIVKFFEIAKNIKRIVDIQNELLINNTKNHNIYADIANKEVPNKINVKQVNGDFVFDSGKSGKITKYFDQYRINTRYGIQDFNTMEEAIEKLYKDLH